MSYTGRDYTDARRFYSKIFAEVLLNMHAVQHGLYHILLCETDSPSAVQQWRQALPHIIQEMRKGPR